jgi:hypothetical protein
VFRTVLRSSASLVVAGIALSLWATPLPAQQPAGQPALPFYQAAPANVPQPPAQTQGSAGIIASASNVPIPVQNPTYYNNVVVPIGGYYPYYDPYGGYLRGAANLVNAYGQFMINNQQASLLQQQVIQSQVDTRNRIIQQRIYEDSITPKTEDVRMQDMLNKLRHSRNNPYPAEIWSGDALNSLATAIQSAHRQKIYGPTVPVPEDALKHLNLNLPGKVNASLGILRDGGKLDWPLVLQEDGFKKDREKLDTLTPQAVLQASKGRVDAKTIKELTPAVERMQATLVGMVQDVAPDQYMDGKKFLRELAKSYKMLNEPEVSNYFGKWSPRGKTVAELVDFITSNGLQIAPASPGDESYYTALYQSFLNYDSGISQLVARQTPPGSSSP